MIKSERERLVRLLAEIEHHIGNHRRLLADYKGRRGCTMIRQHAQMKVADAELMRKALIDYGRQHGRQHGRHQAGKDAK